jgi:hypothetical protein
MNQSRRSGILVAMVLAWQAITLAHAPARTEEFSGNDLRDIRLGMPASELAKSGYVDFACAADPKHSLPGWNNWHDCPADAGGIRAIRFGFDPTTSRDGTMVAGHPAILTLLIAGWRHGHRFADRDRSEGAALYQEESVSAGDTGQIALRLGRMAVHRRRGWRGRPAGGRRLPPRTLH